MAAPSLDCRFQVLNNIRRFSVIQFLLSSLPGQNCLGKGLDSLERGYKFLNIKVQKIKFIHPICIHLPVVQKMNHFHKFHTQRS